LGLHAALPDHAEQVRTSLPRPLSPVHPRTPRTATARRHVATRRAVGGRVDVRTPPASRGWGRTEVRHPACAFASVHRAVAGADADQMSAGGPSCARQGRRRKPMRPAPRNNAPHPARDGHRASDLTQRRSLTNLRSVNDDRLSIIVRTCWYRLLPRARSAAQSRPVHR
jgi:hypothetical protein